MAPSVQYWGRWLSSDSILLPPFLFLCRRLAGPVFYAASCSFHTCPIPLHLDRRGLHLRCQLCSGFSVFAVGGLCPVLDTGAQLLAQSVDLNLQGLHVGDLGKTKSLPHAGKERLGQGATQPLPA